MLITNIHFNLSNVLSFSALVGSAFTDEQEPAFANLRLFQAVGFTVGYLYNVHLCEYIKLYIAAGTLIVSMILVGIVEIRVKMRNKTVGGII